MPNYLMTSDQREWGCITPQTQPFSENQLLVTSFLINQVFFRTLHATVMLKSRKTNLNELDREHLIKLLEYFRSKLSKKDNRLRETRNRLNHARTRIDKLKATVEHQRARIIELMDRETPSDIGGATPGDSGRIQ